MLSRFDILLQYLVDVRRKGNSLETHHFLSHRHHFGLRICPSGQKPEPDPLNFGLAPTWMSEDTNLNHPGAESREVGRVDYVIRLEWRQRLPIGQVTAATTDLEECRRPNCAFSRRWSSEPAEEKAHACLNSRYVLFPLLLRVRGRIVHQASYRSRIVFRK